jgi:rSAM/selenodomain-associated transferase 1
MTPILVFARAPVPGRTKTRLVPALGAEGAARLHRALVRHALQAGAAAAPGGLELWGTGDDPDDELATLAGAVGADLHWQPDGDLGLRMKTALADAIARQGAAIVMGSDCPWLDADGLREAGDALARHDAVLGPADDGGYVLFGMRRVEDVLFDDMPWGTQRVLGQTRERLRSLEWDWHELASRSDVDRPEDLPRLRALGAPWNDLAAGR